MSMATVFPQDRVRELREEAMLRYPAEVGAEAPNQDSSTEHQHLHRVQESAPENEAQNLHKCPENLEALVLSNVRYPGDFRRAGAPVRHYVSCRPRSCALHTCPSVLALTRNSPERS